MTINPDDVSYTYDTRGYMMYYKDQPIGGAGILPSAKGCRSNLKLFKHSAEIDKHRILQGIDARYMEEIKRVNQRTTST